MGISKKKFRRGIKETFEEKQAVIEQIQADQADKLKEKHIQDSQLFSSNTKKDGLKEKRAKLKEDRFKEIERSTKSRAEEKLINRYARKMTNRESMGLEPIPKRQKVANRKPKMEDDDLGDLDDIWATPSEIKSLKFHAFKEGFAKKDQLNVKSVILPAGGQSYNPNIADHKALLKNLAKIEETGVEKELKDLKKLKPFTYGFELEPAEKGQEEAVPSEEEDSSDEEIDLNAPLAVNKAVTRLDIKTQAERNKQDLVRQKERLVKELKKKRMMEKDIDRLENLAKQAENETEHIKKRVESQHRAIEAEKAYQERTGLVNKQMKKIGRFKYNQRKLEYQLEDELSGNLRQLKPCGNDLLIEDRYDSIYRRNFVELDAPTKADKLRQKKLKYKWRVSQGSKTQELFH